MDIGKALTFITEDPRWKEKLAIGTGVIIVSGILVFVLIGILGFLIVAGYCVRLLQNVRDGNPTPLPEWDQWGDDLMRGLKLFVVGLVSALPLIILIIPDMFGSALSNGRGGAATFGTMIVVCISCLSALYGLFLAVIAPGFSIAFAQDEEIRSGLQFRDIWEWTQANIGQLIIVAIVYIAASVAISLISAIVGTLLCLIGLIVTIPLGSLVTYIFQYHLYGQLARLHPMVLSAAEMGGGSVTYDTGYVPPSSVDLSETPPPASAPDQTPSVDDQPTSGPEDNPNPPA